MKIDTQKFLPLFFLLSSLAALTIGCAKEETASERPIENADKDAYVTDLNAIAAPRVHGSSHWQAVQDLCATRLEALGYDVTLDNYGSGVNVVGKLVGSSAEEVILSAHYDSVPGCAGADDNASGVAGVLEAARLLSGRTYERTLTIACWDEEEDGLVGSIAYAQAAAARGDDIVASLVFEMIGYASNEAGSQTIPFGFDLIWPEEVAAIDERGRAGDFIALIADGGAAPFVDAIQTHAEALATPTAHLPLTQSMLVDPLLGDLHRSDHAAFWGYGYSAIMITDTADFRNPGYHCVGRDDAIGYLDHDFAADVITMTAKGMAELLAQ